MGTNAVAFLWARSAVIMLGAPGAIATLEARCAVTMLRVAAVLPARALVVMSGSFDRVNRRGHRNRATVITLPGQLI